jgi:hypothetical protein
VYGSGGTVVVVTGAVVGGTVVELLVVVGATVVGATVESVEVVAAPLGSSLVVHPVTISTTAASATGRRRFRPTGAS